MFNLGSIVPGFIFSGFMFMAVAFKFIVFAVILTLIVRFLKRNDCHKTNALRTLDNKFVNGEITEDEYLKRKSVLSK